MKKGLLLMMAFTLIFAIFATTADAKPRGAIKSPKQSYTQTPKKSTDNVQQSNTGTKAGTTSTAATTKRGFFSGGGLMKGLMIGGIAGLLFGSMFAGMGFLGNIIGLMLNVFAIVILIMAIRGIYMYFKNRRKPQFPNDRGRY
ncbi:putative lipid-binding transport protein (Tim44 family) [Paenibacillus phyllosphaerae]|uniref:Putative lipid-binding transport protein (Tim44 family) n=1 Tax=Paenibacillus phyllosphaerae TaxID=274593 RepID=A0A7W5FMQ7_9BACL|nr:hypothetical protein [Paenibacillus phyllosphaerae]MBB3110398.1 putative lipid-binding transport protein (Tim44 family) [Paenibacillus phyllosphaerae]